MTTIDNVSITELLLRDLGHSKLRFMNVFPAVKSIQNSSSKALITDGQLLASLKTTNRNLPRPLHRPLPMQGLGADLLTCRHQSKASHFSA